MDARLRDLLTTAVGDPPRRVTAEAVRRRVVRRRQGGMGHGTAAVVLLTGLGIVVPGQLFAPGGGTSSGSSTPTGAPRYFVQTDRRPDAGAAGDGVRATATGAVTAKVNCPWPKSYVADEGLAPADGQTFFLACQRSHGIQHFVVTGTRIYRFQLTGSGRIPGYSLVPGGDLGAVQVDRMAADTRRHAARGQRDPGQAHGADAAQHRGRQHPDRCPRAWHSDTGAPGTTQYGVGDLSWTRAGRELVFQATVCTPGGQCDSGAQWRVLRRPATGGLDSSKLLVLKSALTGHAQGYINDWYDPGRVRADRGGPAFAACDAGQHRRGQGRPGHRPPDPGPVPREHRQRRPDGSFSSDPSTRFLILNAGPPQGGTHNGWIDHGLWRR